MSDKLERNRKTWRLRNLRGLQDSVESTSYGRGVLPDFWPYPAARNRAARSEQEEALRQAYLRYKMRRRGR